MTAGLFVLLAVAFARGHHSAGKEDDLSSKTKEVIQNKTQEEMYTSRLERVKAMAKNQGYPKGVIELLDKNEDTIDFVEDYGEKKDQAAAKNIGVKIQKGTIPELIQWNERWGYTKYGTSIVAVSGCGPTCMSMVVSGLTGNMRSNLRYGKNQKREDVKSHHYIISFDPRDGTDNGLTVDKAQSLGEEFCKEHFPGHQAIVCTHPDGHNHSGNIHVHIVINSLRIEAVPLLPYMDRPADTKCGMKHRCTDAAMEYFKSEVMEMCHRENLYQIDLLHGSKNRVTEREYWAQKKGQLALDKANAPMIADGITPRQTKFETDKAKLRQTIRNTLDRASTFDEFSALLLQSGISVKESRGRLSYLTPDRTKPITARKLGDDFDRTAVLALLEQNAHRAAEQTTPIPEYPGSMTGHLQREKSAKIAPKQDGLQRMVDRETKRAEGKGVGYDRWASLHNLKQMAATHNFLMENGLLDLDKLDAAVESSRKALSEARESLRGIEQTIADKKNLRKVVSDYRRTRPTIEEHKKLKGKKTETYYRANEADFIIYEATLRQLKVLAPGKKLPAISKLNTEIEALISEKNAAYNTYRTAKAEHEQLATAKRNTEQILHGTPSRQKKHEQER